MKSFMRHCYYVIVGFFLSVNFSDVIAADTNSSPRLTIELRDGSRVIGMSMEQNLKFHSALLGDLKLGVKDIRSIDCTSTNLAKLTTYNGDVLTVWFTSSELRVNTGFGKVGLSVSSIRRVSVSAVGHSGRTREDLVALWSGDGNANDSVGGKNGFPVGSLGYANGKMGQAFNFDGASWVQVPDAPDLHFTNTMTVEAWVNLRTFSGVNSREIVSKIGGPNLNQGSFTFAIDPATKRGYFIVAADGVSGNVYSSTTIPVNQWIHLAGVYDGSAIKIYVNGQLDGTTPWTQSIFPGTNPLVIGCTLQDFSRPTSFFNGLIDEVSLYNRALSSSEIQDDYTAGDINN